MKSKFNSVKYIYILAGLVFLVGIFLAIWFWWQFFNPGKDNNSVVQEEFKKEEKVEEKDCDFKRKLDGVCVEAEEFIDPRIITVMVENNLEAWPLSGISEASVVYEAPVEGSIPRFLAVYPVGQDVKQVGPVRSARPYYLDWVSEFGSAIYMHVGGSPDALDLIDKFSIFDINEMTKGWYFWRDDASSAPHNTYTSSKLWEKTLKDYEKYNPQEDYDGWLFKKIEKCDLNCAFKVTVPIAQTGPYKAIWKFSSSTEQYVRFQNSKQSFDKDGKEILADTVVVQKVKSKIIDEIGRREIDTIGEGDAYVFANGQVFEGVWKKAGRKDRTKFYDKNGKIIPFKAGKIWVEILPEERDVEWNF